MITLKELRENGNNKEEINGPTKNYEKNISECRETSDDLEDNNDHWILMILWLILMQEHENEKLWKNFQEDIKHNSRFFPKSELLEKWTMFLCM